MHVLLVDYVLACGFAAVAAASAEIDDEDEGRLLPQTNQKIVRFDVSIEITVVVEQLKPV